LKYEPWKVALRSYKIPMVGKKLCSQGEEDKFYGNGWNFLLRESSLGRFIPKKSFPCGRVSRGSVFPRMPFPWEEISLKIFFPGRFHGTKLASDALRSQEGCHQGMDVATYEDDKKCLNFILC